MALLMRAGNGLFAVAFLLSAAVQYNDPDPVRWIAMYLAALCACIAWEVRRLPRAVPIAVGAAALAWAAWIASGTRLSAPVGEALTDWHMHAGGSEELRESLGLVIVAAWMVVLSVKPQRS